MKDLTKEELYNAPNEVVHIYMCNISKIPVGISIYEKCLKDYPEYFPEEAEHRRKWDSVPEEVKDKYFKLSNNLFNEEMSKKKCAEGILALMEANQEDVLHDKKLSEKYAKKDDDLYNKMFNKYGLKK